MMKLNLGQLLSTYGRCDLRNIEVIGVKWGLVFWVFLDPVDLRSFCKYTMYQVLLEWEIHMIIAKRQSRGQ